MRTPDQDSLVRHLLRHIGNPRQLRSNPLVAQLFADAPDHNRDRVVVRRLRAMIAEAMDALLQEADDDPKRAEILRRRRTIVLRCDLGGEPHKRVAAELGIDRRYFYRERRRARDHIARLFPLDAAAGDWGRAAVAIDRVDLSLTHARSLRAAGMHAAAAAIGKYGLYGAIGPHAFWIMAGLCALALPLARGLAQPETSAT